MNELAKEEMDAFQRRMDELKRFQDDHDPDIDYLHRRADDILVEILQKIGGFDGIIDTYTELPKWYS